MPTSITNQELARTNEKTAQRLSISAASMEMTKAHISASREMIARSLQTLGERTPTERVGTGLDSAYVSMSNAADDGDRLSGEARRASSS